jgi:hypothetical protein
MSACPVCGDELLMTMNMWEPSEGMRRHEHYHADNPERERKGLVERICYSAEPMAVARMQLAAVLAGYVRDGTMSVDDLYEDCADDIKAEVYRILHKEGR